MLRLGLVSSIAAAAKYHYKSYGDIVKTFEDLETKYPSLVKVTTAQDEFQLQSPGQCVLHDGSRAPCKQYIVRITNGATLPDPSRPEVFFSGCLHGNERIGPPTLTELALLLVENHNAVGASQNVWLKRLVDTRVIYMMPTTNALGYEQNRREENGIDPNRDFAYGELCVREIEKEESSCTGIGVCVWGGDRERKRERDWLEGLL